MGTSTSHGGMKDRPPLLPDWALPAPAPSVPQPEPISAPPADGSVPQGPPDAGQPIHPAAPALQPTQTGTYGPLIGKPRWTKAAGSLGRVAASSGSRGMGRAAQRYVKALGGSKRASTSSPAGRHTAARFAGFLSDVSRNGFAEAFKNLGLGSVVGLDLDSVIAAVTDAVCPARAGSRGGRRTRGKHRGARRSVRRHNSGWCGRKPSRCNDSRRRWKGG